MSFPPRKRIFPENRSAGFTLLEITFVIAIFAIMSTIVLFRFKTFGTQVSLDSLAQDVALKITGAQNAAISGTGNINVSTLGIVPNYGVYFGMAPAIPTLASQFTYYTDTSPTGVRTYNGDACTSTPTPGRECISVTRITTGDYISNICYNLASAPSSYPCIGSSSPGGVSISFTRPFPDATIKVCTSGPTCLPGILAQSAYVEFTSGSDPTIKRTIVVTSLGQVRVYPGPAALAHP